MKFNQKYSINFKNTINKILTKKEGQKTYLIECKLY